MTKLLVKEYLKNNSLDKLEEDHGVYASPYNGKISFNYSQIEAKSSDKLANQCRGLILREDTLELVAYPFDRFLNYGEGHAADIDWDSAKFEDKLDGSLCIVYFDKQQNRWHVGSRKMCEGQGILYDSGRSFAEFIDKAVNELGHKDLNDWLNKQPKEYKEFTFMLEFCSPYNQVVCKYEGLNLTLLGARNNYTFYEYCPKDFNKDLGLNVPQTYSFNNIEHMLKVVREWSPKEKEGVVVKDSRFNRIKVKSPSYVAYNKLHDTLTSWRACAEVILLEKDDDIIAMLPDVITKRIKKLKPVITEIFKSTEKTWHEIKHIDDRKEFALKAQKSYLPGALFYLRDNPDKTVSDFFNESRNKLENGIPTSKLKSLVNLCGKIDPDSIKD